MYNYNFKDKTIFKMSLPSEIIALIDQLNQELSAIENQSQLALILTRQKLEEFSNNSLFVQVFAKLNNYLLFVEIARRRINYEQILLSTPALNREQIQNAGEDLSELLGQVIDAKIAVITVKQRLENWQ